MVFWEDQPIALAPDRSYDAGGVWSGSATVVDGVPVLSYTCVNEAQLELQVHRWTSGGARNMLPRLADRPARCGPRSARPTRRTSRTRCCGSG